MNLKIGDKVKAYEDGWDTNESLPFIGQIGIVTEICNDGDEDNDYVELKFTKPYEEYFAYKLHHPLAKRYIPFKTKLK